MPFRGVRNLVAHRGQELGLRPIREFRLRLRLLGEFLGAGQFGRLALALADVADGGDDRHLAVLLNSGEGGLGEKGGAVPAAHAEDDRRPRGGRPEARSRREDAGKVLRVDHLAHVQALRLVRRVAEHRQHGGGDVGAAAVVMAEDDEIARMFGEDAVAGFAVLKGDLGLAAGGEFRLVAQVRLVEAQMRDDEVGELLEPLRVLGREAPRLHVDQAQGAETQARPKDQRRASVEAEMRLPDDEGIVAEALVLRQVGGDQDLVALDRVPAEGELARNAVDVDTAFRLEPDPVPVDQADEGDRHRKKVASRLADRVEVAFGAGVEDPQPIERFETLRFADRSHATPFQYSRPALRSGTPRSLSTKAARRLCGRMQRGHGEFAACLPP